MASDEYVAVMASDLQSRYFRWLCDLVSAESQGSSYLLLMQELHNFIFVPMLERDADRAVEAAGLREEFLYATGSDERYAVYLQGMPSVLEVLIVLSRTMDFETSDTRQNVDRSTQFFWEMLKNLDLVRFDDDNFYDLGGADPVCDILSIWVTRQYDYDGSGGVFPLSFPRGDQKNVELWYQMQKYLEEKYPI